MKKRGSHVGVVLSFVIFMTFIFFIYLITQPALKTDKKDNSLEFLARSLVENSSANMTSVSAAIIQQSSQNCVRLSGFFTAASIGNRIIVRNSSESVLQSQIDGVDLLIVKETNDLFFKVYESSEFNAAATGPINPCQSLVQGNDYILGLIKTSESIFETKIIGLIGNYSADYDNFKSGLKISQGNEFDFSFTYNNGTEVATNNQNQTISSNINIYAKNAPIIYVSRQAATEPGFINVKTW